MTVITATIRLARELRQDSDRGQMAAGHLSWPTPRILPWGAWLSDLWNTWLYSRPARKLRLLRESEERVIWEDIVGSGQGSALLQLGPTADAAIEAWNLLGHWNLSMDAAEWSDSTDSEAFHGWAVEFQRRCQRNHWLSGADLARFLADQVEAEMVPVPDAIEMAGFLELTPVQKKLIDALASRGVEISERRFPNSGGDAVRVGLINSDREIRAAAAWCRRILESDPEAGSAVFRIGVIVPDLGRCRSSVERLFAEEFHPGSSLRADHDSRRLFNLSLGIPLGEYPIVEAAFRILDIHPGVLPIEAVGRLLRSPFVRGTGTVNGSDDSGGEWTRRALLDGVLRSQGEPGVSIAEVIAMAESGSDLHHCPQLASQLRAWLKIWTDLEPTQAPSDWAAVFSRLLAAIGWPGDGPLTSAQYQTMTAWTEQLSEFAGLDRVTGRISSDSAAGMLHRLARSRQFQPESDPAPVQVLGVFEASGLRFDRLWIMGMHDGAWPVSAGPDPFVPFRLQRQFDLPRSSPARGLEFTRGLTARLLASSASIVVSYPEREDDSDLRVSPMFQTLQEVAAEDLGLRGSDSYVERLRVSSLMEILEDHDGPPSGDTAPGGGTALFKLQATCGFKAFAALRLGAKAMEQSEPGLSALDRGQLTHRVLDRIWNELRSHAGLLSTSDPRLAAIVRMTVGAAIADLSARRRALRGPILAAIEQARLERVVTELLTLEKQRQPFRVLEREESRRVTVGGINVRIRADRVDRLDDGRLVIVDYKTGECSPADWEGARPDEPQLPIYAVTADAPVAGVLFARLKIGSVGFRGLVDTHPIAPGANATGDDPSLEETIDGWRVVLDQLGRDFRDGRAGVDPKDRRTSCKYCSLSTLCRINEAAQQDGGPRE